MTDSSADIEMTQKERDSERSDKNKTPGRIVTFNDLIEEEQRLVMEVKRNKARITEDFNIMKAKLQPANQALSFMSKLTGTKGQPGFLSHGVDIALDLLSKKYLFRRSNWLVTLAGSYLVRGISQLFLSKAKTVRARDHKFGGNGIGQPRGDEMPNQ
jgi:hypothetical protein